MRSRPWTAPALFLLAAAALAGYGCQSQQQNGQECLKNDDCESKHCVQYVCVQPIGPVADTGGVTDTGSGEVAADAPSDGAADVPAETTAADVRADDGD